MKLSARRLIRYFTGLVLIGAVLTVAAKIPFPLRLDIDVSTRKESMNMEIGTNGTVNVESVCLRVRIRRASGSPHTEPLKAELYVIGRQMPAGRYGVLDVVSREFNFSEERIVEFTTHPYGIEVPAGDIMVGGVYETFLVVVTDKTGRIIETRSGRVISEKGLHLIREQGVNTLLDRDGNVVDECMDRPAGCRPAEPTAENPGLDH